ncbi:MAG: GGDEF domain-containing protein, partial [Treponema sp.]|nr:GGDEF domain-containing protein [Treponema sp.]
MTISSVLYPPLATGLVLVLILIDYLGKMNTDHFQRKLYLAVLIAILTAILVNFTAVILDGRPGSRIRVLLYLFNNIYFVFQNLAYYLAVVFIDYIANKNNARVKKFLYLVIG